MNQALPNGCEEKFVKNIVSKQDTQLPSNATTNTNLTTEAIIERQKNRDDFCLRGIVQDAFDKINFPKHGCIDLCGSLRNVGL